MEKTGKATHRPDSLPLRFGIFAEEFVASEYSRSTGLRLLHDQSIHTHPDHFFMSAHIDRFVLEGTSPSPAKILECKTANPFTSSDWGEAGTDEVPMSYLCQCVWYLAITNLNAIDLAVLFGNHDFRIYEITRDPELEAVILQKVHFFWNEYVLKDLPPPAVNEQDYQTLFRQSDPQKSIEAQQQILELIEKLQLLQSEIEVRESQISLMKQNLMGQMGEAESLTYEGKVLATWRAPKPSFRLDTKRLEAEHPELASIYKIPIQNNRRLVIKSLSQ